MLAAAPMAGHSCDGEEDGFDFVKITTTVLCISLMMLRMCFLGRLALADGQGAPTIAWA